MAQGDQTSAAQSDEAELVPYPGLRPFQSDEAGFFFGRDDLVNQILEKLGTTRFLAIVGESGCGKSSLIYAGVIPALETGFMASAGVRWRVMVMRPGREPVANLARAIIESRVLEGRRQTAAAGPAAPMQRERHDAERADDVAYLAARLRRGQTALLKALRQPLEERRESLLLLVDQFEELFRFVGADAQQDAPGSGRDEAATFVAMLLRAVGAPAAPGGRQPGVEGQAWPTTGPAGASNRAPVPIYVVLTMRSEFLGQCAAFFGLPQALNEGQFLIPRLTLEERGLAIKAPARVAGGRVTPELSTRMLNDMGTGADPLPLMQHALLRLWTAAKTKNPEGPIILDLEDYERIGGLTGALNGHADDVFTRLDPHNQWIAERLFRSLTGGTAGQSDMRRPTSIREVADAAGVNWEEVKAVVEIFRSGNASFLTPRPPLTLSPKTVIDITHESLIRQWKRMRQWADKEARSVEDYRNLESAARRYKEQRGDLLSKLGLANALEWKRREQPTAAWAERYGGDFKQVIEFLDKSARDARATRRAAYGVLAFVVVMVGALLYAFSVASLLRHKNASLASKNQEIEKQNVLLDTQKTEIAKQSDKNRVLLLSRLSREHLAEAPQQATLVAVEAMRAADKVVDPRFPLARAGEEALRRALANIGGIGYAGHSSAITALAVDPGGRFFATGSPVDVMLWDRSAPPETRPAVLRAGSALPGASVYFLTFLNDGRLVVADDRRLAIWDPRSLDAAPKVLWEASPREIGPPELREPAWAGEIPPAVSLHRRWLTISRPGRIDVHDLQAPDPLKVRWPIPVPFRPSHVIVTNDERFLFVAVLVNSMPGAEGNNTPDPRMRVWSLDTGAALAPDQAAPFLPSALEAAIATYAVVTPDRKRVVLEVVGVGIFACKLSGPTPELETLMGPSDVPSKRSLSGLVSRDGRWMIEIDADRNLIRTDLSALDPKQSRLGMPGGTGKFFNLVTDPDSNWMVAIEETATSLYLWDLSTIGAAAQPPPPLIALGPLVTTNAIAVSPEPGHRWLVGRGNSNVVQIWDLQAPAESRVSIELRGHGPPIVPPQASVDFAEFTKDGRSLITAGSDGTARWWPLSGPGKADVLVPPSTDPAVLRGYGTAGPTGLSFRSPAGLAADPQRLILRRRDRGYLWDLTRQNPATDDPGQVFSGLGDPGFTLSQDSRWLAVHMANGYVELHGPGKFAKGGQPIRLAGAGGTAGAFCVSPDGEWLVWAAFDSGTVGWTVRLWELAGKGPSRGPITLKGADKPVIAAVFPPASNRLALASPDGSLRVWELTGRGLESEPTVLKLGNLQNLVHFSRDGRCVALTSDVSRTVLVQIWDLGVGGSVKKTAELKPAASPAAIQFAGSRWLLMEQTDGAIMLWNISASAREPAVLSQSRQTARAPAQAAAGAPTTTGPAQIGGSSKLTQPQVSRVSLLYAPSAYSALLNPPAWWLLDRSERWLVVTAPDDRAELFDLNAENPARPVVVLSEPSAGAARASPAPGSNTAPMPPVYRGILGYTFANNSRWLARTDDRGAWLWSLDDPRAAPSMVSTLVGSEAPGEAGAVNSGAWLVFVGDGERLLASANPGHAVLWDLSGGRPSGKATLRNSGFSSQQVQISPDGNRLVAMGIDGSFRLWTLDKPFAEPVDLVREAAATPSASVASGFGSVNPVVMAFGPGARSLIAPDVQGNVRVWTLQVSRLRELAQKAVGRNLSKAEWARDFPDERYQPTFDQLSEKSSADQQLDLTQPIIAPPDFPVNSPNVFYFNVLIPGGMR
jgi:WD40 repeat protein